MPFDSNWMVRLARIDFDRDDHSWPLHLHLRRSRRFVPGSSALANVHPAFDRLHGLFSPPESGSLFPLLGHDPLFGYTT